MEGCLIESIKKLKLANEITYYFLCTIFVYPLLKSSGNSIVKVRMYLLLLNCYPLHSLRITYKESENSIGLPRHYLDNCFSNMLVKVKLLVTSINPRLMITIFANDSSRQICLNKACPVAPELPKMRQFILVDFDSVWLNKIDLYLKLNWTVATSKFSFLRHFTKFTLWTFLKKIKFSESQGIDFQKMSYWICILICT